jgi:ubiquinone/menaquinone biosynthesis C-methylase UbiE
MKSRGQANFINLPGFAAKLYNNLTHTKAIERQHREIAADLVSRMDHGRLLDVGTGPGKLLFEIHRLNPGIALFGLDISTAMVQLARKNLEGINVELRQGDIRKTSFPDDYFDIITCTGSFYLWDNPAVCLEEIFRILKPGRAAYLFETYQNFDEIQVRKALKVNLKEEGLMRRLVTPVFLMKQLRLTYHTDEIKNIIKQTRFAENHSIDPISLGGLPAWLRIQLMKHS